jgi:hypothetical protein
MSFLFITYYVRPYQSVTDTLSPDGSLDWFGGEAILALSWSVVYISLGAFAIKIIRSAYSPMDRDTERSGAKELNATY